MSRFCDRVNLFLGTAGDHGQMYPGAEMPFGLVKLGPDTFPGAVTGSAHAGYDYDDKRILGFSHLRFSGVGCNGVGGNVLVMPMTQQRSIDPSEYAADFDKASERCAPGYYSVVLEKGLRVELTATHHVGLHRYMFPEGSKPTVLIDLTRGFTPVRDVHCIVRNDRELAGELISEQMGVHGRYRMFFCVEFQRPFKTVTLHPRDAVRTMGAKGPDGRLVAMIGLERSSEPALMRVGWSSISIEQARRNMEAEVHDWDFARVREMAANAWEDLLGRIEVSGDDVRMSQFYSHIYRTCLSPFHITSSRGTFMGEDGEEHAANGYIHYNGWSMWDSYRTKFPLLALLDRERIRDMMHSLTDALARRRRQLPVECTDSMHGFSAIPNVRLELSSTVLVDAFQKGIEPVDLDATYGVVANIADAAFRSKAESLGYVPRRPDLTCEYAYDNWAAAQMAGALGKEDDFSRFKRRAAFYKNTWDASIGFYRARDERGDWLDFPEDATEVVEKYVYEGSMWHWRWATVHDIPGVIKLIGGQDVFVKKLDEFYARDLHNHGNQPSIHAPWLFAAAGAPWLTQKWVRSVLTGNLIHRYGTHGFLEEPYVGPAYRNAPDGLIPEMDDDDGCMSGWFVFSSMGFFPLCVGRPIYALGTPLFEEVTIHNAGGRDFVIRSSNGGDDRCYIQSARLNGKSFDRPWLTHQEIMTGGCLDLSLARDPNKEWGTDGPSPW